MDEPNLKRVLEFAVDIAQAAGEITLRYFPAPGKSALEVITKADRSPVTVADREAEQYLRNTIEKEFPSHGILGEEFPDVRTDSPFRWIVDPIDGTKSFIRGVPLYGILIGYEAHGQALAGVVHFPALRETVHAAAGMGCFWNGTPARVSTQSDPGESMVLVTDTVPLYRKSPGFAEALLKNCRFVRTWGDCYGHILVATGRAEVMIDPQMSPWDCGPMKPILEEAGGHFTDWDGKATIYGKDAFSSNAALYPVILDWIRSNRSTE